MPRKIPVNRRDLVLLFDATEALEIRKRNDLLEHFSYLGLERLSMRAARNKARLMAEMRHESSVIDAIRRRRKDYLGPKSKSIWELFEEKSSKRQILLEKAKKTKGPS